MNEISREMLRMVERDETLTSHEREFIRQLRRGETAHSKPVVAEKILRRVTVAERCACTVRTVDRWCSIGLLPRMKLPGHSRASGIPESAVNALIAGANAMIATDAVHRI